MAIQTTRVFVIDSGSLPVVGAIVGFNSASTGLSFFTTTDSSGKAEIPLEEGVYSVSISKQDLVAPEPFKIEVSAPPGPTAAFFNPPAMAVPAAVDATSKNIQLAIDGGPPILIDVSGGDNVAVNAFELASNINTALGAVVASVVLGEVRLTSPTVGSSSEIVITNDGSVASDATDIVFGLVPGSGNITVNGEDTPLDWNDFDAVMIPAFGFVATDPDHCVLWGRFWRQELTTPLVGASVFIRVLDRPAAIDLGIDVGDSFYSTTNADGFISFTLMRRSRVEMHIIWRDLVVEFTVPDSPVSSLDAILTPYVVSIVPNSDLAFSMRVGETRSFSVIPTLSDGSVGVENSKLTSITYMSNDDSIGVFSPSNPGIFTALAAGVVNVTISARNTRNEVLTAPTVVITVLP